MKDFAILLLNTLSQNNGVLTDVTSLSQEFTNNDNGKRIAVKNTFQELEQAGYITAHGYGDIVWPDGYMNSLGIKARITLSGEQYLKTLIGEENKNQDLVLNNPVMNLPSNDKNNTVNEPVAIPAKKTLASLVLITISKNWIGILGTIVTIFSIVITLLKC